MFDDDFRYDGDSLEVSNDALGRIMRGEGRLHEGFRVEGDGGILVARGTCMAGLGENVRIVMGPCTWTCRNTRRYEHVGPTDDGFQRFEYHG